MITIIVGSGNTMSSAVRPVAPASPVLPPAEAPAGWDATVSNITAHGVYVESPYGPTMGMESIRGPRDGTHEADYMSLFGGRLADGSFFTSYVTLVSEKWQLQADGNFRIDQWLHLLSRDGKRDQPTHKTFTQTPDGIGLDTQYFRVRAGDPEVLANTAQLVTFFGQLQPQAPASVSDVLSSGDTGRRAAQSLLPRARTLDGLTAPGATAGVTLR